MTRQRRTDSSMTTNATKPVRKEPLQTLDNVLAVNYHVSNAQALTMDSACLARNLTTIR